MATHWPFPGSDEPPQQHDLPTPRYAVGDRVTSSWGGPGIVVRVEDWPSVGGHRAYCVHHDWSTAPATFGHLMCEDDLQPLAVAAALLLPEDDQPAREAGEMELFAC